MYRETTDGILIEVNPSYLREHSDPVKHLFVFAYEVTITNESRQPVRLVARHWVIRDGDGAEREIAGEGVVGDQPRLIPGGSFTYSSFCPLPTPTGSMRGTYLMVREDGTKFEAKIPLFFLRDLAQYQ
jgi:ApaG protein